MLTQEQQQQQSSSQLVDSGENIYENVVARGSPGGEGGPLLTAADEPPPPPQPPYATTDEPRVRLERDRERRSIRKLTKDSGYETSQYAESDYANLDLDSEQAGSEVASASDRSPTNKSTCSPSSDLWGGSSERDGGSPHASSVGSGGGVFIERYRSPADPWRTTGHAYWGSQPQYGTHRNSSYPSKHRDNWESYYRTSRYHAYSSSEEKATSPPPYDSSHIYPPHHRKTGYYNVSGRAGESGQDHRPLGRHSSTDSLTSGSSSVFSYPLASVSSAKSTPSLSRCELDTRRPIPPPSGPSSPSFISSSRSTPNLEHDIAASDTTMVSRRLKKPSVYETLAHKSGLDFSPLMQPHPYWEDHESRDEYEAQIRSAAAAAFHGQHSRQVSSQSSGSERTTSSSAYSHSMHSRQVSSQSSFSEDDFRIQSIKEEFMQRTSNQDCYHLRYGSIKEGSYSLSQYAPQKFYSSDNLISSFVDDADEELSKVPHFTWAKSQPDLKDISQADGKIGAPMSPPPPPVRDASSLKYNGRFTPGHEKFPSWPITMQQVNDDMDVLSDGEKPDKPIYNRSRKYSSGFTQYLKPVIENPRDKAYEIPAPVYGSSSNDQREHQSVNGYTCKNAYSQRGNYYDPHFDGQVDVVNDFRKSSPEMDTMFKEIEEKTKLATKESFDDESPPPYSPPRASSISSERRMQYYGPEIPNRSWSSENKAQPQVPYTRHKAQSTTEGNESSDGKGSSPEGDSSTPLMDRLRRESQQSPWAVAEDSQPGHSPPTGRESVTSSNSSQETLKWHGSTSDVSVVSERTRPGQSVETIVHSARVQPPQRHHSESVLYYSNDQQKLCNNQIDISCITANEHNDGASSSSGNTTRHPNNKNNKNNCSPPQGKMLANSWRQKSPKDSLLAPSWADQVQKNNYLNSSASRKAVPFTTTTSFVTSLGHADDRRAESLAREEFRCLPPPEYAKPLSVAKRVQDLERQARNSNTTNSFHVRGNSTLEKRSNKEAVTTTSPTFPGGKVEKNIKPGVGSSSSNTAVAEGETVHHSPTSDKPLYLDPEKKHRVSDPELKAIQKQAVLSFFERQTGLNSQQQLPQQHQTLNRSPAAKENYAVKRPHSLPRDSYQEFKNHTQLYINEEVNARKGYGRLDSLPEVDPGISSQVSSPSSSCSSVEFVEETSARSPVSNKVTHLSSNGGNHNRQGIPVSPTKIFHNGSLRRKSDTSAGSNRVALYYNTYTQTLPWSENDKNTALVVDSHHYSASASCGSSPVKTSGSASSSSLRSRSEDENHHPRKNIAIQTDCTVPPRLIRNVCATDHVQILKENQTQQSKLTVSPAKAEDPHETEDTSNSISNHFLSRLSSVSTKSLNNEPNNNNNRSDNNKLNGSIKALPVDVVPSRTPTILDSQQPQQQELSPPERPPKRPHLRPRSSSPPPPPLLPRAQPAGLPLSSSDSLDENSVEDLELKKIEESAEELRNLMPSGLSPLADNQSLLEPPDQQHRWSQSRTPSPDLPLPPPPRMEDDVMISDEPLPPPPSLNEVSHFMAVGEEANGSAATLPRTARSPPISYPKNSYMSYRNEKHPGRHGFDGNYHRKSPVNSGVEDAREGKQNMESVTTSLTPTAWERWHNIGRPSATVVFTSNDIRSSGTSKAASQDISTSFNHNCVQTKEHEAKPFKSKISKCNQKDKDSKLPLNGCSSTYKHSTSSSFSYGDLSNRESSQSKEHHESESSFKSLPHKLGVQKYYWASLDSLTPQSSKTAQECESSALWSQNRQTKVDQCDQSADHMSHSSLQLSDSETQTTNVSDLSETELEEMSTDNETVLKPSSDSQTYAKLSLRDQRKNSSTQTGLEVKQLQHVEVMTQTTPSINKNGRLRRKEVIECDQLTKVLASQLPEEDRALQALLIPKSQLKTMADYMEGLFEMDPSRPNSSKKQTENSKEKRDRCENPHLETIKRSPEAAPLPADSAYFTTSESKAKFLTRYSIDVNKPLIVDLKDSAELGKKKEELINSIGRKLDILRAEQLAIQEEILANQELGVLVTARIEKLANSNELDKYKQHIEETEKITSLLLSLSGRLARAENALMGLCDNANQEEKQILEAKRDKLFEQHEEAKKLKENIDRRSQRVSEVLHKYLTSDEYADFDHFIKMKSKLLIDSKEIDEKINLGEEQMLSLKQSLDRKL